jgi:ketosteroid isomerase-like protein
LPWAGRHVGSDGVKRFFHLLAESMTYEGFDMQHVVADASTVVPIIEAWGFAKATGRTFRGTIVRIYVFRDGKIAKVQNIYDTAAYAAALRPA